MWLRRLVGLFMILTCIGLNILTILGLVLPDKTEQAADTAASAPVQIVATVAAPSISLNASPAKIDAGSSSGLKWATSGSVSSCSASSSWSGAKTPFGAESTGRIGKSGNYTYTLTCKGPGGQATASTTVSVGNAPPPAHQNTSSSSSSSASTTYCGGRLPCYGPKEVAQHGGQGNCWGWNGDRVINISGFDAAYHEAKSGISSIQISQVCGHDLAPSLNGSVSAGGVTRNHNQTTKENADPNEIPYFVGYFDAKKP